MAGAALRHVNRLNQESKEACAKAESRNLTSGTECKTVIERMHDETPWLPYVLIFAFIGMVIIPMIWKRRR